VSGQWLLSVYEALAAQLSWFGFTRPSAPAHTTCRIGLLRGYAGHGTSYCMACILIDMWVMKITFGTGSQTTS